MKDLLGKAGMVAVLVLVCGALAVFIAPPAPPPVHTTTETRPSYPERLAQRHHCWTSQHPAPMGALPGHAVVTLPGDKRAHLAPAQVGFDLWLGLDGKEGSGDEAEGVLHAFCP